MERPDAKLIVDEVNYLLNDYLFSNTQMITSLMTFVISCHSQILYFIS